MTGKQLIAWITEHHAEDMTVVIQFRDGGGYYRGGETLEAPCLANAKGRSVDDLEISYRADLVPNAIVL